MNAGAWAVIGSLLTIVIGLWKYFTSKEAAKQRRKEDGYKLAKEGMAENDISKIVAGTDDINNS
jgi:hypothetical protein